MSQFKPETHDQDLNLNLETNVIVILKDLHGMHSLKAGERNLGFLQPM
jgi:hypothetical protein